MQGRERNLKMIKHFSHHHPLTLHKPIDSFDPRTPFHSSKCPLCNKLCYGLWLYCCEECVFVIDNVCAKYPQHVRHPFHPQHSLSIYVYDHQFINASSSSSAEKVQLQLQCDACGVKSSESVFYHCPDCKFYLHQYCLELTPHDIHHQDLIFVCNPTESYLHTCSFCKHYIYRKEKIYVCLDRKNLFHEQCFHHPRQIKHPFHAQHPLDLVVNQDQLGKIKCNACSGGGRESWPPLSPNLSPSASIYYKCLQCRFELHTSCASLLPTKSNVDQGQLQPQITHSHPLIQCDNVENLRYACSGCKLPIKGSVFVCLQCNYFLDKSCSELPQEIRHPLHSQHRLNLVEELRDEAHCCICKNVSSRGRYIYVCQECHFQLDCRCAMGSLISETKLLMSQVHSHPLAFFKTGLVKDLNCSYCYSTCKNNFFQCLRCKFAIHLECHPLPKTIKHDCHCDPLTLTYFPIEEDYFSEEDGDKEFYCFACEELRDPQDPTYCCKECPFVAHLLCVLSEILRHIEAESETRSPEVENIYSGISAKTIWSEIPNEESAPALGEWVVEEKIEEILKEKVTAKEEDVTKNKVASTDEKIVKEDHHIQDKDTIKKDIDVATDQKIAKENIALQDHERIKKEIAAIDEEIAAIDEEIAALQTRKEQLKERRIQFLH